MGTTPQIQDDYIGKTYNALKNSVDGFNKSPEEYRKLVTSDNEYRGKVFSALKNSVDGFDKDPQTFNSLIIGEQKQIPPAQPNAIQQSQAPQSEPANQTDMQNVGSFDTLNKVATATKPFEGNLQTNIENPNFYNQFPHQPQQQVDLGKNLGGSDFALGQSTANIQQEKNAAELAKQQQQEEDAQFAMQKHNFQKQLGANHNLIESFNKTAKKVQQGVATQDEKDALNEVKPLADIENKKIDNGYKQWGLSNISTKENGNDDAKLAGFSQQYYEALNPQSPNHGKEFDLLSKIHSIDNTWQPDLTLLDKNTLDKRKVEYQNSVDLYQLKQRKYEEALKNAENYTRPTEQNVQGEAVGLAAGLDSSLRAFKQAEQDRNNAGAMLKASYDNYVLGKHLGRSANEIDPFQPVHSYLLQAAQKFFTHAASDIAPTTNVGGIKVGTNEGLNERELAKTAEDLQKSYGEKPQGFEKIQPTFGENVGETVGQLTPFLTRLAITAPLIETGINAAAGMAGLPTLAGEAGMASQLLKSNNIGAKSLGILLHGAEEGTKMTIATQDPEQFKVGAEYGISGQLSKSLPILFKKNPFLSGLVRAGIGGAAPIAAEEVEKLSKAGVDYMANDKNFNDALKDAGIDVDNLSQYSKKRIASAFVFGVMAFPESLSSASKESIDKLKTNLVDSGVTEKEAESIVNPKATNAEPIPATPQSEEDAIINGHIEPKAEQPLEEKPTPTEVPTETKINEPINKSKNDIAKEIALSIQPSIGNEDYYLKNQQEIEKNPIEHLDRMINYLETKTIPEGKESNSALLDMHERKLDELKGLKEQYLKASEPIAKIEAPIPHTEDLEGAIKQTQFNIDNNINPILDERQQSDAANILSEKEPTDDIESVRNQISKIEGLENSIAKGSEATNAAEGGSAAPESGDTTTKGNKSGVAETEIGNEIQKAETIQTLAEALEETKLLPREAQVKKAKNKLIDKHFENIFAQLTLKEPNKYKRIC
jgi:hypothetical protein